MLRASRRPAGIVLLLACAVSAVVAQPKPDALKAYREGRYEEARTICLAELEATPGNIESYVVLAWSLLSLGRYAEAERYATIAYATVRKDPRIVEALGEASYYLGKNAEALKYFQAYVNLLPDGSRIGSVYYLMGEVYLRLERLGHADIALRTALQYEPGNAAWWTRLGYVRERAADWTWSLQAYETALRLDPAQPDARLGRDRVTDRMRR